MIHGLTISNRYNLTIFWDFQLRFQLDVRKLFESHSITYAKTMNPENRSPYVWDYDISAANFQAMLAGTLTLGRLGQDWATIRLLEYATYPDIIRLLGYRRLIEGWERWRKHVRGESRKRSFDFLVEWIPANHPELLIE
jgi:hypothetical protein